MGKLDKGRCGLCCSQIVRISKKDIEKIKQSGYKESYFVETASDSQTILKRINGYCIFLVINEGIASCKIYESRPKVCREFECIPPGFDDCKLKRHYHIVGYR
jgi:Fe-S-cluster containining protein